MVATIWIWTQILKLNSIYIKNWLNLIKNCQKQTDFVIILIKIDLLNLLIDIFDLLTKLFDLNIDLLMEIDQTRSILYQNRNRWLNFIVGFQIWPKSTIEFGWPKPTIEFGFQIWFDDDDLIPNPLSAYWSHVLFSGHIISEKSCLWACVNTA